MTVPKLTERVVGRIIDQSETSLVDVIDNLLTRGVVLNADLILALADVDLVYLRLSALLCAGRPGASRRAPMSACESASTSSPWPPGRPATFSAAGHRIEFVKADAVYAAVERLDERPAVSEAALRTQHDIVARIAAKVDAILPARFGSLVDVEELERVVALRREAIRDALDLVRGRAQMTVRLFDAEARRSAGPRGHGGEKRNRVPAGAAAGGRRARAAAAGGGDYRGREGHRRGGAFGSRSGARGGDDLSPRRSRGGGRSTGRGSPAIPPGPDRQTMSVSGPWPPFAFVPELWP